MKKRDILLLLCSGFILVVAWVGFSIYHNLATSTVSAPLGEQIRFIAGTFDTTSIDKLKNRKKITIDITALDTQATPAGQPRLTITPTSIPTSTQSASIATESANQATQGGTLNP